MGKHREHVQGAEQYVCQCQWHGDERCGDDTQFDEFTTRLNCRSRPDVPVAFANVTSVPGLTVAVVRWSRSRVDGGSCRPETTIGKFSTPRHMYQNGEVLTGSVSVTRTDLPKGTR